MGQPRDTLACKNLGTAVPGHQGILQLALASCRPSSAAAQVQEVQVKEAQTEGKPPGQGKTHAEGYVAPHPGIRCQPKPRIPRPTTQTDHPT
jgi:hypothetical protein